MKKCEKYNVPLAHFLYNPFEELVKNSIKVGAKVLVAGIDVSLSSDMQRSEVNYLQNHLEFIFLLNRERVLLLSS